MVSNEKQNMSLNFKLPDYDVLDPIKQPTN